MSICNFLQTYGEPPNSCTTLPGWLAALTALLVQANGISCGTDGVDPTSVDLEGLFAPCDVPDNAFVSWYNSISGDTLYFFYDGTNWWEFTIP